MRGLALLAVLLSAGAAQAAGAGLTEPAIRAFLTRQEAAWNSKDASAFAATFTPDARFVAQARDSHGGVTANGSSTLPQAMAQAQRFFAKSRFRETSAVESIAIAPDGRSAQVTTQTVTHVETPGHAPRNLCAETRQTVVLVGGQVRSRGQTETDTRCPH